MLWTLQVEVTLRHKDDADSNNDHSDYMKGNSQNLAVPQHLTNESVMTFALLLVKGFVCFFFAGSDAGNSLWLASTDFAFLVLLTWGKDVSQCYFWLLSFMLWFGFFQGFFRYHILTHLYPALCVSETNTWSIPLYPVYKKP